MPTLKLKPAKEGLRCQQCGSVYFVHFWTEWNYQTKTLEKIALCKYCVQGE